MVMFSIFFRVSQFSIESCRAGTNESLSKDLQIIFVGV